MNDSVFEWVGKQVAAHGLRDVSPVLEVGSYDVNGTVRPHFRAARYVGVDVIEGPGVDRVVASTAFPFDTGFFETVVSTEMLEHAEFPAPVLWEIWRVLRPGGVLILTTRSEGFPPHNPPDYHRFSIAQIRDLLIWTGFSVEVVDTDPEAPGVFVVARKKQFTAVEDTRQDSV